MTPSRVGIDVVDLRNARTHDRHLDRRFMARIFGAAEVSLIRASDDPARAVWRHWAAKEAAFKAICAARHPDPPPIFRHADFEVVSLAEGAGELRWHDTLSPLTVLEDPHGAWVACVAASGARVIPEGLVWRVESVDEAAARLGIADRSEVTHRLGPHERSDSRDLPHAIVRLAARTELARQLGVAPERLEIVSAAGPAGRTPPRVHLDGEETGGVCLSISHDGPRVAWAVGVDGREERGLDEDGPLQERVRHD
ncbi:MAG: 4'-phosphopantetheinyl transferase superfamily protein [Longimicrobiales bacterium]|nr:4'-phosphopantetheinyl transferase superfamily protein [Longimicrobiales bacterium]